MAGRPGWFEVEAGVEAGGDGWQDSSETHGHRQWTDKEPFCVFWLEASCDDVTGNA